jgi:hypothetical protein
LEGMPNEIGWNFDCKDCGAKFTKDEIKRLSKVSGGIFC